MPAPRATPTWHRWKKLPEMPLQAVKLLLFSLSILFLAAGNLSEVPTPASWPALSPQPAPMLPPSWADEPNSAHSSRGSVPASLLLGPRSARIRTAFYLQFCFKKIIKRLHQYWNTVVALRAGIVLRVYEGLTLCCFPMLELRCSLYMWDNIVLSDPPAIDLTSNPYYSHCWN